MTITVIAIKIKIKDACTIAQLLSSYHKQRKKLRHCSRRTQISSAIVVITRTQIPPSGD